MNNKNESVNSKKFKVNMDESKREHSDIFQNAPSYFRINAGYVPVRSSVIGIQMPACPFLRWLQESDRQKMS